MKYFAGIALPENLKDKLSASAREFSKYRWEKKGNLHLTLYYFGTVEKEIYPELVRMLGQTVLPGFSLTLDRTGFFSHKKNNTILWAGPAESQPLRDLQRVAEDAAVSLGWQREKRGFHPHVTLLKSVKNPPEDFENYRRQAAVIFPLEWNVESFHLFSSEQGADGMDYRIVEEFRLPSVMKDRGL